MDTKKILTDLHDERKLIDAAIAALEALSTTAVSSQPAKTAPKPTAKKRVLSPEGRKHIADAAKKRWAKAHAAKSTEAKSSATEPKRKPMSAATKKRLSELAKKNWAKRKKAAKAAKATAATA